MYITKTVNLESTLEICQSLSLLAVEEVESIRFPTGYCQRGKTENSFDICLYSRDFGEADDWYTLELPKAYEMIERNFDL